MYITTRSRRKLVSEHQFGCNSCDPEQKRYTRLLFSSPEDFWTAFSTEVAKGSLKAPGGLSFIDSSELKLERGLHKGAKDIVFGLSGSQGARIWSRFLWLSKCLNRDEAIGPSWKEP